jgi:hypothetical protein
LRLGERALDPRYGIGGALHRDVVLGDGHAERLGGGRDIAVVGSGAVDNGARGFGLAPPRRLGASRVAGDDDPAVAANGDGGEIERCDIVGDAVQWR